MKNITKEDSVKIALFMGADNSLPAIVLEALGLDWFNCFYTNEEVTITPTPKESVKAYRYLIALGYESCLSDISNELPGIAQDYIDWFNKTLTIVEKMNCGILSVKEAGEKIRSINKGLIIPYNT